jgi:hypothetical protein
MGIRRPSGIREIREGEMVYRQDTMIVTRRFADADRDGIDETLEVDAALPLEFWRYEVSGELRADREYGGRSRRVTGREDGRTHVRFVFPADAVRGGLQTSPCRLTVDAAPLEPRDSCGPYYPTQAWSSALVAPPAGRTVR